MKSVRCNFVIFLSISLASLACSGQKLPPHFFSYQVAKGLTEPTSIAFLSDDYLLVSEKSGKIKRLKIGDDKFDVFYQVKTETSGERGLQNVIVHPDFLNHPYFFIYYTRSDGLKNRLSRVIVEGKILTEAILLEFEPMGKDAIYHNGGGMAIWNDKIYLGVGEQYAGNSNDLNSYNGKIVRLNLDGSIPNDNPTLEGSVVQRSTWSYGLRNPFNIDIDQENGRIFVNDVGYDSWEEINDATRPSLFFGWPYGEGSISHINPNVPFADPIFKYPNIVSDKTNSIAPDDKGCSITSGFFYRPAKGNFPNIYHGRYFFSDMCNGWVRTLDPVSLKTEIFSRGLRSGDFGFKASNNGEVYYLNFFEGTLSKIIYDTIPVPRLLRKISNVEALPGDTITISASFTGGVGTKLKWFKDGKLIQDLESTTLVLNNLRRPLTGIYSVVAYNEFGSDSSNYFEVVMRTSGAKSRVEMSYRNIEPLLRKNTCSACHNLDKKLIGPSFMEISKRSYNSLRIVGLIYNPEPKNWPEYTNPMMAMPYVKREEALKIANWICSLKKTNLK